MSSVVSDYDAFWLTRLEPTGCLLPTKQANALSEFFTSTFTKDSTTALKNKSTSSVMKDVNITLEDVLERLININTSKSPGPDNIHPRMLKELANELCKPLLIIFSKSLSEGKIPED